MKTNYIITVGEVGSEIGHELPSEHVNDEAAIRKARREVAPYHGDGWWLVTTDNGLHIASGGRRTI
jgi:hypothetical protein